MKKLLLTLLLFGLCARAADVKISELPAVTTLGATDTIEVVQTGANSKLTGANLSLSLFTTAQDYGPSAVAALAIDTTKALNTKTVSADSTFTFSATPAAGTVFSLELTNSDTANHAITIPSSVSSARGGAITAFTLPASSRVTLTWFYTGSDYSLYGDPTNIGNLAADTTPGVTNVIESYDGAASVKSTFAEFMAQNGLSTALNGSVTYSIGNGVDVITTGYKGAHKVQYSGTITGVEIVSNDPSTTSGSIVIDVWKDTYANFPPANADSITAADKPTVTTATKSQDLNVTTWGTTITAGDYVGFEVESVTSFTKVLITLIVTKN